MTRTYRSSQRERSAAYTRQIILQVAQELFAKGGYAATTVAEIAREADVAVTTVYGSVGNKSGIVLALIEDGAQDPAIAATIEKIRQSDSPDAAISHLAAGVCASTEKLMPLIRLMYDTAPADPAIAAAVIASEKAYRRNLEPLADHLRANGWLRPELSEQDVADMLWFHFGISALRTLSEMGWSWLRMQDWLSRQVRSALLA
ncbi:TetR/AcrR family transcriptional regulator [Herbiconiux daphne]|uniref:TetR/AcrR family transcriptional regulator n=1 Tax=Herbiconiux daphne TaxID=2970914 RepID=A0ABT2H585_9MICO|nr:TetR/AcrR family transcriptional regulator [Herbiconiux daphne]MCS5735086.1 TetR/AcrR family transcriptional regulator [Herbiconiux daphne]